MKWVDLEEGQEVFVKMVVSSKWSEGTEEEFYNLDLVIDESGLPENTYSDSCGEVSLYKADFKAFDVKPLTKVQRNAKTKLEIKGLEDKLKTLKKQLV